MGGATLAWWSFLAAVTTQAIAAGSREGTLSRKEPGGRSQELMQGPWSAAYWLAPRSLLSLLSIPRSEKSWGIEYHKTHGILS